MKKIIISIITLIIIFSSFGNTFAEEWYIEKLLDLNYGAQGHKIELIKLNNISFNNSGNNNVFKELQKMDTILRTGFMNNYRNWEYSYAQMEWIITSYRNFIYYANKFFSLLKMQEKNPSYEEIDDAIIESFWNMKSTFKKLKNRAKNTY